MKHEFDSVPVEMWHKEYEFSPDKYCLRVKTELGYETFSLDETEYQKALALLTDSDTEL